ncbi:MAG: hypothetical protein ACI92E_000858 [Oceanicoccus sp.]|jgi:hypothetical protein
MIPNIIGLMIRPEAQWQAIAEKGNFSLLSAFLYTAVFACVPAFAWYYGTTVVGWTVGDGDTTRLTTDSAATITILFYFVMVASVYAIGYMMHWMSETYSTGAANVSNLAKCISIASFTATPLFIVGAIGFIPVLWVSLVLGVVAACYAVYLLYIGIPIVMGIPKERGFLYASAVIAFCLVLITVIMGGSVIAWDMGAAPSFTD